MPAPVVFIMRISLSIFYEFNYIKKSRIFQLIRYVFVIIIITAKETVGITKRTKQTNTKQTLAVSYSSVLNQ